MDDTSKAAKLWLTFAGGVLVVAVLYWAQAVLVPFALAILLTFVLTPPVNWLQQWVGRVPAVLLVVTLVFAALGLAGLGLAWQVGRLVDDLPVYRANIRTKIADVRVAGSGGAIEKLQEALEGVKADLGSSETPTGTVSRPLVVASSQVTGPLAFAWLGPVVGPLTTAGLVAAMVIFMLLERRDLRNRLIGLIGQGQLATTTKAFDEASTRVSQQLLMQSLVSLLYGIAVFVGLYFFHVPYPLVWAALGAAFRFIPYIGPVLGAGAPILVSLAALEGWTGPLTVLALFVVLELFTNLVLETVLYAGAVGVSQVVLLVSVAFWTWLWGPLGLLMASPLTVCVVVLGKHVPGLAFVGLLMDETAALAPEYGFYQRLLARDQSEAVELIETHVKTAPTASVYDALLLPALSYAERDRLEHRLSSDEEATLIEATRELIADAAEIVHRHADTEPSATAADRSPLGPREPLRVLGYAVNGAADEVALAMLARLFDGLPIAMEITGTRMQAAELVLLVGSGKFSIVCFANNTVLANRLDGAMAAPVNCLVTNALYSHTGRQVLVPAGARILGETKPVQAFGETRLAVSFHRLLMPDGRSYRLDQFMGLNQIGDAGLRDKVNHHFLSTFGAAATVGLISGLSQYLGSAGLGSGDGDRTIVIAGGVGDATSQAAMQVMNRFLNRLPTITIREGHRVKVYLTSDIELPAYTAGIDSRQF